MRTEFVSSFFVLGRVLGHFCNVLLQIPIVLKQNIEEMSQDVSQIKKTRYKTPPLIIQDQFGIIQNLQVSPIPQSSFLPWPFFAQQDGSSTQFKSMQYLNDFHNWIKIVMTEIILTMCLSSLKNIYVKLFLWRIERTSFIGLILFLTSQAWPGPYEIVITINIS